MNSQKAMENEMTLELETMVSYTLFDFKLQDN
jgi:hypothetical protein